MRSSTTSFSVWLALLFSALLMLSCLGSCGDDEEDSDDDQSADDDAGDDDTGDDDASDDDDDDFVVPPVELEPPPWPEWVLRHWVWEDESTQDSALALVEDYLDHEIPVGAIIIDSPWETGYNTFEHDPDRYPDPQAMIDRLHELDVRVFYWITPNVNVDSPNYQYGLENGYYLSDGRTVEWWKGEGSFIDYTNPEAVAWWHSLMDNMLDMGIDGWKCDGTEPYLYLWGVAQGQGGLIWPWEYPDMYYRDFYEYTRRRLGPDRVITARPYDSYALPVGLTFAPRDVCHAGWVGDQDPTFFGMRAALLNMFESARLNYVNFGSDIGGYREDEMRDPELLIRWAQLGALCPVMENGGGGEHRPWMYEEQLEEIYREFTRLHHRLIPYQYSQGATSYEWETPLMRPQEGGKWQYLLGDSIFVSVLAWEGGQRQVDFPEGTWIDYFTGDVYQGGTSVSYQAPLERFPMFVKLGSILPMYYGAESIVGPGAGGAQPVTLEIRPDLRGSFSLYEEGGPGAIIGYNRDSALVVEISASSRNFALRIVDEPIPSSIWVEPAGTLDRYPDLASLTEASNGWCHLADDLWVKPGSAEAGLRITVIP